MPLSRSVRLLAARLGIASALLLVSSGASADDDPAPPPVEPAPEPAPAPEPVPAPEPAPAPAPAPAPEPVPAPAPASASAPASAPAPASASPPSPSQLFARSGSWLLSVDDALPIFSMGGGSPLDAQSVLRFGDPGGLRSAPKPFAFDVAASDRFTLGGYVVGQGGLDYSLFGLGFRAGWIAPLAPRLALWPRFGVTHVRSTESDTKFDLVSRTDIVLDARLAWIPHRDWALTVGPTVSVPVQHAGREATAPTFGSRVSSSFDDSPALPRIGVSAGITGFLSDAQSAASDADGSSAEPRFFLSVDRVLPLMRYRKDLATERLPGGGATERADGGLTDVTTLVPQAPRLAFDWRFRGPFTVGAAASVGFVRASGVASMIPSSSAPSAFSFSASPRLGARLAVARSAAFWPRIGVTYVNVSTRRNDLGTLPSHHLGADVDALLALYPVRRLAILLGPSLGVPLTGATTSFVYAAGAPPTTQRVESTVLTVAFTAGLVAEIP